MKPNATSLASLDRALPQVERMGNRLRRCAAMASTARHPWTAGRANTQDPQESRQPRVEMVPAAAVASDALLATVFTPFGIARLAIAPLQWPALASAATLADAGRRHAVATLLLESRLGPLAALVSGVELQAAGAIGDVSRAGVALHVAATRFDVLAVDDRLLTAIESHVAGLNPVLSDTALDRRLPSRIVLASRSISVRRLSELRVGDVIVLPSPGSSESAFDAWLSWGEGGPRDLRTHVLLCGATMSLTTPPAFAHAAESDAGIDAFPSTAGALLARLELPVCIELAGPVLRLADIADLKSGDVLELPIPIEQAQVRITVARQGVGLGELVVIGGRLGVRILRMDVAQTSQASGGTP